MAKSIYVGNLAWQCSNSDLLILFQEHGEVAHAQVITDHDTGRPRGFGFVEMPDEAEAEQAIAALNGSEFQGRILTVNAARRRALTPRS